MVASWRGPSVRACSATRARTLAAKAFPSMGVAGTEPRPPSSPDMEAAQLPESTEARDDGVLRYYHLAKRAEWQVRDLPWGDVPAIPEARGGEQKQARRRDIWRSVIMQQLQADMFAVEMSAQLL